MLQLGQGPHLRGHKLEKRSHTQDNTREAARTGNKCRHRKIHLGNPLQFFVSSVQCPVKYLVVKHMVGMNHSRF